MISLKPTAIRTILCVATVSLAICSPAQAADKRQSEATSEVTPVASPGTASTALALAREIVSIGYPEETREALFFRTMDQMMLQMRAAIEPTLPADDPEAIAILDEWIAQHIQQFKEVLRQHIPNIMAGITEAYATIFTPEELRDILVFVRTPSGQRYFELSPMVLSEKSFADANQRYLDDTIALLGPAQRELMQRLNKHMNKKQADNTDPDT